MLLAERQSNLKQKENIIFGLFYMNITEIRGQVMCEYVIFKYDDVISQYIMMISSLSALQYDDVISQCIMMMSYLSAL